MQKEITIFELSLINDMNEHWFPEDMKPLGVQLIDGMPYLIAESGAFSSLEIRTVFACLSSTYYSDDRTYIGSAVVHGSLTHYFIID